jgi:hypothetical protein
MSSTFGGQNQFVAILSKFRPTQNLRLETHLQIVNKIDLLNRGYPRENEIAIYISE